MKLDIKRFQNWCLILYLFFLSFFNFTPFYLISAIFLIFFTGILIFKRKKIIITSYIYYEIFFIVYNVIYLVFNITKAPDCTIAAVKTLCLNLVINLAIINTIQSKAHLDKILKCFVPIAAFACIFIIIYTRGAGSEGRLAHGYPRLFSDTNYTSMEVASWALYASVFAIINFYNENKKRWLIALPLFWTVIVWSGSRKCLILSIILQVIAYITFNPNKDYRKIFLRGIGVCMVCILLVFAIIKVPVLYNKVGNRIVGYINGTESSANGREAKAKLAKQMIKNKPLTGYGLATFRKVNGHGFKTWTENNYLELAVSGGVILPITYYLYLVFLLTRLAKIRNKVAIEKIMMIIIICIMIFDIMTVSYLGRLESFFIALGSWIVMYNKKEKNDERECN